MVPTRKTPPINVNAETNECTDFYTDGANLCGDPPVKETCGSASGNDCTSAKNCSSGQTCGLFQQKWPCNMGPAKTTGCNMGVELDLFEGNKYGFQCTTHNCTGLGDPKGANYQPECDQFGNTGAGYTPRNVASNPYSKGWKTGKNFGPK